MSGLKILVDVKEAEQKATNKIDIDHLFEIKKTSQSFLKVNGFDISSEPDFHDLTSEQFVEFIEKTIDMEVMEKINSVNFEEDFRSSMSKIYHHTKNNNKILMFFLPTPESKSTVGVDVVKNFCKLIVYLDCNEGVIISEKSFSSGARKNLEASNIKNFCQENIYNVISYIDEKFINIVDHCLSPKVLKIYSGEELEKFEKENNVSRKEFPRILITDPIAKFHRARVGNVIEMVRKTGTMDTLVNEQLVYRLVIYSLNKSTKD